jgi:membrane protein
MNWTKFKNILVEAYKDWQEDEAPRMGAALAYYTVLSLAPLLIITIAVAGLVLGEEAARGQLLTQISGLVGEQGGEAIQSMVQGAQSKKGGIWASILGFITLLWGASAVVGELQASLNKVWDVQKRDDEGLAGTVKQKSYAMALVLGCGFLLLVSLAVSAGIAMAEELMNSVLPLPEFVLQAIHIFASLAIFSLVFAAIFRFLPQADVEWSDVIPGAIFTALLFTIGKFAIGLYLGKASFGSTYGAAGSLVIVLVWVYYSAQIFFFGAEVTYATAESQGSIFKANQKKPQPQSRMEPSRDRKLDLGDHAAPTGSLRPMETVPQDDVASKAGAALGVGLIASRVLKVLKGR